MLVPWLLPGTRIALGLTTTYGERHAVLFNYVLVGTLVLMLIGYTVIKLPFSYRMVKAVYFSIDSDLSVFLYHPLFQPLGIVIKAASDGSAAIDAKAMGFVYTVVLMILSSVALDFGQGDGMERIRR